MNQDILNQKLCSCALFSYARQSSRQIHILEKVKTLISEGADPNVKCELELGNTPLHAACLYDLSVIVNYLLTETNADINATNDSLLTPLHLAAGEGYIYIVEILVERGADINAKDYDDYTPLHEAALYRRDEVITYLIKKGSTIDFEIFLTYPDNIDIRQAIHKQMQMEDMWASVLIFILRAQDKYTEKEFKENVSVILKKIKGIIPAHINIILSSLL